MKLNKDGSVRRLGYHPRKKIPSYEITMDKLSSLFKEKNWNWGDKITIYEQMKEFIRKQFFVRKGRINSGITHN